MANGRLSPRQKMINLMYLVFIAMLALNMSKEVLSAFGFMNEKLTENNASADIKLKDVYANLDLKATEQAAKFNPLKQKADKIKTISSKLYSYLDNLKSKMTANIPDKKDYEVMDKTNFLDEYFFEGDNFTKKGQEFVDNINEYRKGVVHVLGKNNKFNPIINKRFSTEDEINRDGKAIRWLDYRYKSFPLIASITNISQIQSDIKNTETDIITSLLGGKLEEALSLDNYKGIIALDKNAYFTGENVTGKIVLGRYDATLEPDKVILNDKEYDKIESGQVIIDLPAGRVGSHDIKGKISFTQNNEVVEVPFKSSYSVIPEPNTAVVSADKMNVVYRGLDNPISVSLPGVSHNAIRVSLKNGTLKGSKGKYIVRPGAGKLATISVSAKLSNGKIVRHKKSFRIKDLPPAMGSVRGEFGTVRMPKSSLTNAPISAGLPDFEFDLKIRVKSFKIKVPNQLTVIVKGTKLTPAARKVLSKAKRGDQINIYDIKATANGLALKKVLPVSIELTN